jgi:hypothetical protein
MLQNKMSYITKIMPAGWELACEHNAGNRIMGEARNVLRRKWAQALSRTPSGAKALMKKYAPGMGNRRLADFFLKGDALGRGGMDAL